MLKQPGVLKVLDLFSGIGGFSLGLERAGMETVAFCEIDKFCQQVLKKHWPDVPVFKDITKLDGKQFNGAVDVVCGGFPCQPFSVAGKQKAEKDSRHLWPEMLRIIRECRPTWIIGENVKGIIKLGLDTICKDLEAEGYAIRLFNIPACGVGAPHRRERIWIIAHTTGKQDRWVQHPEFQTDAIASVASNADNFRCKGSQPKALQGQSTQSWELAGGYQEWRNGWPVSAPRVCGVDDGIPNRTHRLKSLGNAVVPQIPELIGRAILSTPQAHGGER